MQLLAQVRPMARRLFDPGKRILAWIVGAGGVVEKNWARMGWPDSWPPLKPSTQKDKARHGYNPWADQKRTGKLLADAKAPGIAEATEEYVRVAIPSSQNAYAAAHQFGVAKFKTTPDAFNNWSTRARRLNTKSNRAGLGRSSGSGMPARPVYQVSDEDLQNMANALAHDLLRSEGF
jgi:phage gpG-like protein